MTKLKNNYDNLNSNDQREMHAARLRHVQESK